VTDCVFCRIVAGEVPAHWVYEDPVTVAFLDARPVFKGHVLVVPRQHYETLGDLPPAGVGPLFEPVRQLSVAVPAALGAQGTFVALNNVVSQSVPQRWQPRRADPAGYACLRAGTSREYGGIVVQP